MSLIETIKADALAARKAKDARAGVLITLIGEINKAEKAGSEPRVLTDADVIALVRKFLKNIADTMAVLPVSATDAIAKASMERGALERYLPSQMSEAEIEAVVRVVVADGGKLGDAMARLKADHAGLYDGKLASTVAKRVLEAA